MYLPLIRNCIDQETVPEETVPQYRTSRPNREMCSLCWHATKYGESYAGEIRQSFVSFWLSSTLTLPYNVDSLLRKLCSPASHGGRGASRHHWTTAMPWQGSGTPTSSSGIHALLSAPQPLHNSIPDSSSCDEWGAGERWPVFSVPRTLG